MHYNILVLLCGSVVLGAASAENRCGGKPCVPELQYCDMVMEICASCQQLCADGRLESKPCKENCPEYQKKEVESLRQISSPMPEDKSTEAKEERNSRTITIWLSIVSAVMVVTAVILIIRYRNTFYKKAKTFISSRQGRGNGDAPGQPRDDAESDEPMITQEANTNNNQRQSSQGSISQSASEGQIEPCIERVTYCSELSSAECQVHTGSSFSQPAKVHRQASEHSDSPAHLSRKGDGSHRHSSGSSKISGFGQQLSLHGMNSMPHQESVV